MGVTQPRPTSISGSDFYEDVSETAPTLPPPSPLGLDLHEAHWEACVLALACIALLLGLLGILSVILYDVYGRMQLAQEEKEQSRVHHHPLWSTSFHPPPQTRTGAPPGSFQQPPHPTTSPFVSLYDSVSINSLQHCL